MMDTFESTRTNAELDRQDRIRADAHALLRFLGQALTLRQAAKKSYDAMVADSPISPLLCEFINGLEAAEADAHAGLLALEGGRYADDLPAMPAHPGVKAMDELGKLITSGR